MITQFGACQLEPKDYFLMEIPDTLLQMSNRKLRFARYMVRVYIYFLITRVKWYYVHKSVGWGWGNSEDTQEMPQSRRTAFARHKKNKR